MRGLVEGLPSAHPLGPAMPALYQEDDFAQRFVAAFDEALAPVLSTLDNLPAHVDPGTCPDDWVDYLGSWLGLAGDTGLPLSQRRDRLRRIGAEQAVTGTADGIRSALTAALGVPVAVSESGASTWSPTPGSALPGDREPCVWLRVLGTGSGVAGPAVTPERVRALARDVVPAHVRIEVEIEEGTP